MESLISERDTLQSKVEILNHLKAKGDLELAKLQKELVTAEGEKRQLETANAELTELATEMQDRVIEM
ncbi:MAG: hypothetical protein V2I33_22180 [Kangiellaceae bacterium]|jgi:hypothetical protein|nr:hypothetical protein [Kangiellaceae bacterium]